MFKKNFLTINFYNFQAVKTQKLKIFMIIELIICLYRSIIMMMTVFMKKFQFFFRKIGQI